MFNYYVIILHPSNYIRLPLVFQISTFRASRNICGLSSGLSWEGTGLQGFLIRKWSLSPARVPTVGMSPNIEGSKNGPRPPPGRVWLSPVVKKGLNRYNLTPPWQDGEGPMCDLWSFFFTSICHFWDGRQCAIKSVYTSLFKGKTWKWHTWLLRTGSREELRHVTT